MSKYRPPCHDQEKESPTIADSHPTSSGPADTAPQPKRCPRCGRDFVCRTHDIAHCQCAGIAMTPQLSTRIKETYDGCLCRHCLQELARETGN
ncbi:cysteine-rich CWC family protein [Ruficoccus amylovorans]|uniref:Cysteine-rich CWC family protein n=1 Tax=Ruficoccus amylovorans TaxID=1804625 RepID=A0A842HG95_9BACT|nr:cysteine-rich CWC family protein [Ruficoccus amylovorans]MBC2595309.1 cysteine-rich CWC family protein [Ruficoccus amylovorans]